MALPPQNSDAFVREVDEELRRDQIFSFWRRWGRLVFVAVLVGLAALAGWLFWQDRQARAAGAEAEKLTAAIEQLSASRFDEARPTLTALAASDRDGYRAAGRLALGAVAMQNGDLKAAAARFGEVANDTRLSDPLRHLALVRQTAAEFDQLPPDTVVQRLQPIAQKGSPWFGSAGEMVAAAHLKAGRRADAAAVFAAIAADPGVPQSIRSRAVQIAGVLGVDASVSASPSQSSAR